MKAYNRNLHISIRHRAKKRLQNRHRRRRHRLSSFGGFVKKKNEQKICSLKHEPLKNWLLFRSNSENTKLNIVSRVDLLV